MLFIICDHNVFKENKNNDFIQQVNLFRVSRQHVFMRVP